jgi:homoserine kinase
MNEVTIRIPATSANLGPGYDCLGVALQIYNQMAVRRANRSEADDGGSLMAAECSALFFEQAGAPEFPWAWSIEGDVPRSRGMGSSVTVRLGLLHGLNELAGRPLTRERLFALCAELEGHPDNAAPAAFGGFTVAGGVEIARFPVAPQLHFVLLIPDFEVSTPAARSVLPAELDRRAAAQSCANACRITAAFAAQNYGQLRGAFADQLHQPFREKELIPFLSRVIAAGEHAGAIGGFLSGSGSTICCVVEEKDGGKSKAEAIGAAMLAASGNAGARILITTADNTGATVL